MFRRTRYFLAAMVAFASMVLAGPSRAALIEVTPAEKDSLSADAAQKAGTVKNVTKIERYLLVKTQPHDVIGVEVGVPLRLVTSGGEIMEAKLETGKPFSKADEGGNVALVGNIYAEDYGYRGKMDHMGGMMHKHFLEVGQTFNLVEGGPRIRVLGTFSVKPDSEASKVFLPLATAQKLFDRTGKISHLFITVSGDPEAVAKELQTALGGRVKVKVVSR